MKKICLILLLLCTFFTVSASEKDEVVKLIYKVNDYWQKTHKQETRSFWDNAAYHTGNMEVYRLTGEERYRQYSEQWAAY